MRTKLSCSGLMMVWMGFTVATFIKKKSAWKWKKELISSTWNVQASWFWFGLVCTVLKSSVWHINKFKVKNYFHFLHAPTRCPKLSIHMWKQCIALITHSFKLCLCVCVCAGVRGVRPDRMHSWLHLHHTWRLDPRWVHGAADWPLYLCSQPFPQPVYSAAVSVQRSDSDMAKGTNGSAAGIVF